MQPSILAICAQSRGLPGPCTSSGEPIGSPEIERREAIARERADSVRWRYLNWSPARRKGTRPRSGSVPSATLCAENRCRQASLTKVEIGVAIRRDRESHKIALAERNAADAISGRGPRRKKRMGGPLLRIG